MLEKVDLVIVGAEGVVESGGIINKVGLSEQPDPSHGRSPDPTHFISEVIQGQLFKVMSRCNSSPATIVTLH